MKISKKYIFGVCIFIALLCFATPIILFVTGHNNDISNAVEKQKKNGPVIYGIDDSVEMGNVLEEYRISGWAFTPQTSNLSPTSDDARYLNSDKSISLFLTCVDSNSEKMYPVLTSTTLREDIFSQFHKKTSISGIYHGFSAEFSTLHLPDGIYQLCINTKENNDLAAFSPTDVFFEKRGRSFTQISYLDEISLPSNIEITSNVNFGIDAVSFDKMQIDGWTLMANVDMSSTSSYLLFTLPSGEQHVYRINRINFRNDLSSALKNDTFQFAGFKTKLPENIKDKEYFDLQTMIEFNGNFYLSEKIRRFDPQNPSDSTLRSATMKSTDLTVSGDSQEIRYAFDNISVQGESLQIIGWAVNKMTGAEGQGQAYLEIVSGEGSSQYYALNLTNRPDITAAFGEEQTENGFTVQIPLSQIPSEKVTIAVVYQLEDQAWRSQQKVEFDLASGAAVWLETEENTVQDSPWPTQLEENISNTNIRWAAEDISRQGSVLQIAGWTTNLIPDIAGTGEPWMQLKWEDGSVQYYPLTMQKRDDIAQAFGSGAEMSGFLLQIPFDQLENGTVSLSPVFLCEDGVFSSEEHIEIALANEAVTIL